MVAEDDVADLAHELDVPDQAVAEGGMALDDLPFLGRERSGLLQDGVGDGHLAGIVEEGALADALELPRIADAGRFGEDVGVAGDRLGVAVGLDVAQVERGHEILERRVVGFLELPRLAEVAGQLLLQPLQLDRLGRLRKALPGVDIDAESRQKCANFCPFFVIFDDQNDLGFAH